MVNKLGNIGVQNIPLKKQNKACAPQQNHNVSLNQANVQMNKAKAVKSKLNLHA